MEWPEPWSRLAACGWTTARLGTLDDLPKRGLREVLNKAWGREATVEELEEFHEKVKECGSTGRIQWGVEGRSGGLDWVAAGFKRAGTFRQEVAAEVVDLEALPSRKGKAPLARWPCRLSRLVGRAGDNMDLRDRAERLERTRWTAMLKRIIVESELPASAGWNADPDGTAWHRIGKGRRSTTLRKHVKTWRHVATWLYSTYNVPWPRTIEQFIEYIMHRVAEPCGKSIRTRLMKTLMFMEGCRRRKGFASIPHCRTPWRRSIWSSELGSARTAASGADPGGDRYGSGEIRDDGGGAQLCLVSACKALGGIALLRHSGNALRQVGDERPRTLGCSGEDQDHRGGEEGPGPARLHLGGGMAGGAQVASRRVC